MRIKLIQTIVEKIRQSVFPATDGNRISNSVTVKNPFLSVAKPSKTAHQSDHVRWVDRLFSAFVRYNLTGADETTPKSIGIYGQSNLGVSIFSSNIMLSRDVASAMRTFYIKYTKRH